MKLSASARKLDIDCLWPLATAIRLRVEADLLVFRQSIKPGCLHGRNMHEDIGAAAIRLDEAEAFVDIEEFYNASLGHTSGPSLSARHPHEQQYCLNPRTGRC